MKVSAFSFAFAALIAAPAMAQTHVTGVEHCAKPDPAYSIGVGDQPGHGLGLSKTVCTWSAPLTIAGEKARSSLDVSAADMHGMVWTENGYSVTTTENGDTFTVQYSGFGTAAKDGSGTFSGAWNFIAGTGKLKGLTGGGSFKGAAAADGSASVDVEGDYTIKP